MGPLARLTIGWCTLFVVGTDLFVVSPLLPLIAADLGVSPARAGLSVTAFSVTYMVSAPLMGYLADRVGRWQILTCCLFAFAGANLLTAAAENFAWLLAARVLAGAMAAGVSPSLYALVGDSAPPGRRATWMAMAVSGLLVSLSLGAPIGAVIGASFGWARVFAGLAALSVILVWANWRIWQHVPPATNIAGVHLHAPVAALLAQRLAPTVVWSTALYGMYTYLGTWLALAGYSTEKAAEVIAFYGCGAIIGTLAGGRLADRFGAKAATGTSLVGLGACFLLLPLALRAGVFVGLAFGLASAVAQLFFPAQQAGLVSDFPNRRATVLAWNNSSLFLGIALGSLVGGQAVAFGSFETGLIICAAIAFAGWAINWMVVPRATAV